MNKINYKWTLTTGGINTIEVTVRVFAPDWKAARRKAEEVLPYANDFYIIGVEEI